MRGGASTGRGWPTPTGTAWRGRATWCGRARPGPRSSGCGAPALALPNDAPHHTLDHDVALVHAQRRHGGVGGLEPDPAPPLPIKTVHRGAPAPHPGDHRLALVAPVQGTRAPPKHLSLAPRGTGKHTAPLPTHPKTLL